jgi:mono/diheme cytochrome c family protein
MSNSVSLVGVLCLGMTTVALAQGPAAPAIAVPDVVRARCVTCHGIDLIQQQRLSRAAWERELDKMVRWGAVVPDADRRVMLDYFETIARPLSSGAATPTSAGGRGAELYTQRCLGCHGSDIVEQQRLGTAGWRREVDKMVGWGARVEANDKEAVTAYLADRFGVR